MRSYEQYCAVAKALDVVGDRWTLLIVRELFIRGRCRYTDLRDGLPGIATNLLVERLRELEEGDVIARELAGPPIATTLYQLTDRGKALGPVLQQLGLWGAPLLGGKLKGDAFRSHWLAIPLGLDLKDNAPGDAPATIEIRADEQPLVLELTGDGAVHPRVGAAAKPDAVITGEAPTIIGLFMGRLSLKKARAEGLRYEGNIKLLRRIRRK